jgi:hypothetical protein
MQNFHLILLSVSMCFPSPKYGDPVLFARFYKGTHRDIIAISKGKN